MKRWRYSSGVALAVAALFLVVQLAVPIGRFGDHQVTPRFGWQMFATFVPAPEFLVETVDEDVPVALDEYMAWPRSDIDIIRYLPEHLCDVVPEAITVVWETGSRAC